MSTDWLAVTAGILAVGVVVGAQTRNGTSPVAELGQDITSPEASDDPDTDALNDVVQRVCVTCHNDRMITGGLSLEGFRVADAPRHLEEAEAMITKLRLDMMPPPGRPRPGRDILIALAETLERTIDESATVAAPGRRPIQYMNRAEYENAIQGMLGLEIDADAYLPGETISEGFDNIADVQVVSGTLLNGFLRAAGAVSRLAIGDPHATPVQSSYSRSRDYAQWKHVDGAPVGTRGGIVTTHTFLADGEYVFRAGLLVDETGALFGNRGLNEKVEVAIDGERVALLDVNPWMKEQDPQGAMVESDPVLIRAGQRTVSATFIKRFEGPVQDIFAPIAATVAATTEGGRSPGITALPHMGTLTITGPYDATGVSDNPVRERIFTCRPESPEEEGPCARQIIGNISAQAYRRPPADHELEELVSMYESRAADAGFDEGIKRALQAILSSPHFIFRIEEQPQDVDPGEAFAINDFDLATRLAQFLWARPPDDELRGLAAEQKLSDEGVLKAQVERMLDDPRSESLATRFAAQWLRLPDLKVMRPDPRYFPFIHEGIKDGMRRETELFFYNIVEEDRPVTELMTADYTFVNEDLAKHYGIPGVTGEDFRRVQHTDEERYGLLGQASILTQTSFARRTSPVNRGKFVMEVLLGTAPPPPPPNVPDLEITDSVDGASGRALTVKERMEMHRVNPTCSACHQYIDPLGLPLEGFGPTGEKRIRERAWATVPAPIDSRGTLWTGQPVESPSQLREIIANDFREAFLRNFTENLSRYALGRQTHARDQSTVRSIVRVAAENDYRFSSFATGIVMSDAFRMMENETMAAAQED
jgi:mono/diheme cytochrome c family protein